MYLLRNLDSFARKIHACPGRLSVGGVILPVFRHARASILLASVAPLLHVHSPQAQGPCSNRPVIVDLSACWICADSLKMVQRSAEVIMACNTMSSM